MRNNTLPSTFRFVSVSVHNIVHVVSNNTPGVAVAWQKILQIVKGRLQQRGRRTDAETAISERSDEVYLVLSGCEWVPFSIKSNKQNLKKRNKPKDPITTVPKRDVFIVLPYLGLHSKFITKQLKAGIYKFYGCINLKIIFRNTHRINSLFPYKNRVTLTALLSQRLCTRLAAGTVMTFI